MRTSALFPTLSLFTASVCLAQPAFAQGGGGSPTAEMIARGATFDPPRIGDYAARLAQQPDISGSWNYTSPDRQVQATIFDPYNAVVPFKLPEGEQEFGPRPGTYLTKIPYKPEYQKKYMALVKETTEGKSRDTFAACVPYGVPRMIGGAAGPMDIVQSPEVIIWQNVYSRDMRRIFLDGRAHPSPDGPEGTDARSLTGHSVGHWDGDTLVIDTANMMGGYYDETPAPFSNQIHVVERIRLIDNNVFEDQMTITDPVMLERPWVVTRYFRRGVGGAGAPAPTAVVAGAKIVHTYLNFNDRPCVPNVEIDKNGFQVMHLPQETEAKAPAARKPAARPKAAAKKG